MDPMGDTELMSSCLQRSPASRSPPHRLRGPAVRVIQGVVGSPACLVVTVVTQG
jgi:hypothetical protein